MSCPTCGGPMKPLFTGEYCPNDCDKPREYRRPWARVDLSKLDKDTSGSGMYVLMQPIVGWKCPCCWRPDQTSYVVTVDYLNEVFMCDEGMGDMKERVIHSLRKPVAP